MIAETTSSYCSLIGLDIDVVHKSSRVAMGGIYRYQKHRPIVVFKSDGVIYRGLAKYRSIPSGGILIMAALWNRAGHYIFSFFFLLSFFLA